MPLKMINPQPKARATAKNDAPAKDRASVISHSDTTVAGLSEPLSTLVELDRTLASLYSKSLQPGEQVILVAAYPRGDNVAGEKYIYHDSEVIDNMTKAKKTTGSESVADIIAALNAQKFAVCAGPLKVMIFCEDGSSNSVAEKLQRAKSAAQAISARLVPSQRAELLFFNRPSDVTVVHPATKLAPRLPMDALAKFPHVINPDLHYELLSKRGLALSKLQTPACDFIEYEDPISTDSMDYDERAMKKINDEPLPFVVKLQQTIFGKGTFILRFEQDRKKLLEKLPALIEYNTRCRNKSNQHLKPATLILSELIVPLEAHESITSIQGSISLSTSFAVAFFVNRDGTHEFMCTIEQDLNEQNEWEGAAISYLDQARHEDDFSKTIFEVTRFLHGHGYYGAVGIDVLIGPYGKQWVVDMNVRAPGSLILGLLKGFLADKRKFYEARLISAVKLLTNKKSFESKLAEEIAEGKIILTGWVQVENAVEDEAWAAMVISGKSKEAMNNVWTAVKRLAKA